MNWPFFTYSWIEEKSPGYQLFTHSNCWACSKSTAVKSGGDCSDFQRHYGTYISVKLPESRRRQTLGSSPSNGSLSPNFGRTCVWSPHRATARLQVNIVIMNLIDNYTFTALVLKNKQKTLLPVEFFFIKFIFSKRYECLHLTNCGYSPSLPEDGAVTLVLWVSQYVEFEGEADDWAKDWW